MSQPEKRISFEEGISRKDLKLICQRFTELHTDRLQRILGELTLPKREYIELLPLLFHINHPMLPGYVKNETPQGVPDYSPTRREITIARKFGRSFQYERRGQRQFDIEALYLMGSTGSIGQASESDFDLWLCHIPGLDEPLLELLQKKAALIEKAAKEFGLELHIFLIDSQRFRTNGSEKITQESSGNTQHSLLLEEFYRSAVLLAGRYPLWWLVPPEQESNYQEYADNLLSQRFVRPSEVIDLGGLSQIPAEEFFAAALWQLYKGIDAPYKAILKIFLMEAYSRDYPKAKWLAEQAKEVVYAGQTDLNQIDSYILLYRRVEAYLLDVDDQERLELARRCLYFKVGEQVSRPVEERHWRNQAVFELTKQWGWTQEYLAWLDTRADWKIEQVAKERNNLVGALFRSYRLLTEFAREHSNKDQIYPQSLNLLGRKLYTALNYRPGKVDMINPGISANLTERSLSLHHRLSEGGELAWMLYPGNVDEAQAKSSKPCKLSEQLIEVLLWAHVNQLWGVDTEVAIYPKEEAIKHAEIMALLNDFRRLFPPKLRKPVSQQELSQPAGVRRALFFINIGQDPLESFASVGMQLTSDRHDPLSFASGRSNLFLHMEELLETSWGELLVDRRAGESGLLAAVCNLLNLQADSPGETADVQAFSHSSIRGDQISTRVVELCRHMLMQFAGDAQLTGRYIFSMGRSYFLVSRVQGTFKWRRLDSFDAVLLELERPQTFPSAVSFDPEILGDTPYPALARSNQVGDIQLFYQKQSQGIQVYLLDENGALFRQNLAQDSLRFLMLQTRRFLNSLLQLRNLLSDKSTHPNLLPRFYELMRDQQAGWVVNELQIAPPQRDDYVELALVTDSFHPQAQPIALICNGQEFGHLEFGDGIYQKAANFVKSHRKGKKTYPLYLTSIQYAGLAMNESPSTVELFCLKREVEQRLNQYVLEQSADHAIAE